MRRLLLVVTVAVFALAAQTASAQQGRDHRRPAPPAGPPHPPPRAEPMIQGFGPASGPPGTTIKIHGVGLTNGAMVRVGHARVSASLMGDALAVPLPADLKPGKVQIEVELHGKRLHVGEFEVVAPGPGRDHRGPGEADGDHDRHGPPGEPPGPPDRDHRGPPGTMQPPPGHPPGPPMPDRDHRAPRHWKMDRPVISSYWPMKGEPGTRVVIRGANFAPDMTVMWGGAQVDHVKISPDRIELKVPKGAKDGMLTLHGQGLHRDLPIGMFNVTRFDAAAQWKKDEAERQKAAEAAWAARQGELAKIAKDKAARAAWLDKREADLRASREDRRAKREAELRAKWEAAFLTDPETQAELGLHAQRLAKLDRMARLAESLGDKKLGVRIEAATSRENQRHDDRMAALKASFQAK